MKNHTQINKEFHKPLGYLNKSSVQTVLPARINKKSWSFVSAKEVKSPNKASGKMSAVKKI